MAKQRFLDLLTKLKEWAEVNGKGDEQLNTHLNALEAEITAMDTTLDDSGGSTPPPSKERGS